ncbi:phospholipase D-like domain-containing protein [Streptomyces sp. NBC_00344]|uniref:phospholipase D-like domain-containing protein n=1 Tax=Streptomyces sp. NBC_00344 TaxID=2975720 RepID=UPI002E1B43AE
MHSKYLLIDGMYDGTANKLVWTGSHNYSGPSLRENDEALLKVDDSAYHDAYVSNFNAVKAAAVPGTADGTDACKGVVSTDD